MCDWLIQVHIRVYNVSPSFLYNPDQDNSRTHFTILIKHTSFIYTSYLIILKLFQSHEREHFIKSDLSHWTHELKLRRNFILTCLTISCERARYCQFVCFDYLNYYYYCCSCERCPLTCDVHRRHHSQSSGFRRQPCFSDPFLFFQK